MLIALPARAESIRFWVYGGSSRYTLVPYLEQALARWRAATCLDLDMSAFAPTVRVRWDSDFHGDGVAWSNDGWATAKVRIDALMPEHFRVPVLIHELGHALRKTGGHGCAPFSFCNEVTAIQSSRITTEDLNRVCAVRDCACYAPES